MEKNTTIALAAGLAAVGVGVYFWQKNKKPAANQTGQTQPRTGTTPTQPGLPSVPGVDPATVAKQLPTGTVPAVVAPPPGVQFNELPDANKLALWQAVTMFKMVEDPSNKNVYTLSSEPATSMTDSGSSVVMQRNDAQGGDGLYILVTADPATDQHAFWAAAESDAVAQASGPSAPWTVFLKPNEWRAMAEKTYASSTAVPAATSPVPGAAGLPNFAGAQDALSKAASYFKA